MSYSAAYYLARESWRDWRIEAHELVALSRVGKNDRVLEIGCGAGGLGRLLVERGAVVVGVDTLKDALEMARTRRDIPHPLDVVSIGQIPQLPFPSGGFDQVIGQHVIEHLANPMESLCEWNRVLKPGGRLALATPNALYPDPAHFADPDHRHVFTADDLSNTVQHAGFDVEFCCTVFPYLSRLPGLGALGVVAFRWFHQLPYFSAHGRTVLLGARKP